MSERTAQLLGVVALAAADRMRAAIEDEVGGGGGAGAALVHVQAWPGGSVNGLAAVLGLSQPATVRLVDRLVARGLLTRGPGGDGRTRTLSCTRAGDVAATGLLERRQAALEELVAGLDADALTALDGALGQITRDLAGDRAGALHACRLCDRATCCGERGDDCPLEHTTSARTTGAPGSGDAP